MHNLYTKFVKIIEICKQFSNKFVNETVNIPRRGPAPKFSDLELWYCLLPQNQKVSTVRTGYSSQSSKNTRVRFPT